MQPSLSRRFGPESGEHVLGGIVRNHDDPVSVPHDDVAGTNHDAAGADRVVDLAGAALQRADRGEAASEYRQITQGEDLL
jgi:hypothetical protein